MTFGDGSVPVDLGAVSGSLSTQHVLNAARDLYRFGDRDGEQRCRGDRLHPGGGRTASSPECLDYRQCQPRDGSGDDVHHHRGARPGQFRRPERSR